MSILNQALRHHATQQPKKIAINDQGNSLSYADLLTEIELLAARLRESSPRVLGILADNSCAWALADLAAHYAGIPVVPIPLFFSPDQIDYVIRVAGIDQIITDQAFRLQDMFGLQDQLPDVFHADLSLVSLPSHMQGHSVLPAGTQKLTFTSGTTGEPKGVCLTSTHMETVAESLRIASAASTADTHLCVLPLATLLENIGGVYTPLLAGATVCIPRLAAVGLSGSSGLDIVKMINALNDWQASSAILVPQMLQAMVGAARAGVHMPSSLRYLAVGGAPVAKSLLHEAQSLGLPVYEGYGLSECASVVAVNNPNTQRLGSVGKPLPHIRVEFADDGEILIRGMESLGYLGETKTSANSDLIATGDLGHLDQDGFLYLTGRKKNIFITSFGRNVAPEWVERELVSRPGVLQAAVFGESRPFNSAVIVPHPKASVSTIEAALNEANRQLPDYARVRAWVAGREAFSPANGMSTENGRLRRANIMNAYAQEINALYR